MPHLVIERVGNPATSLCMNVQFVALKLYFS
jgi:hypothetical protein